MLMPFGLCLLLNSADPYFLDWVLKLLGAPIIKKFGIEPLSMGYIIVGEGGTVSVVGKAEFQFLTVNLNLPPLMPLLPNILACILYI